MSFKNKLRKKQRRKSDKRRKARKNTEKNKLLSSKKIKVTYIDGVKETIIPQEITTLDNYFVVKFLHPEIGKVFKMLCRFTENIFLEISGGPPIKIKS